jgi:hypothetical protein
MGAPFQYDKASIVLRIDTTTNDVSFFKHHRKMEHRKSPATRALAAVKKSIYSLIDLREILLGCNRRYLAHLSALDDISARVHASPSRTTWMVGPSRESTSSNPGTVAESMSAASTRATRPSTVERCTASNAIVHTRD